MCTTQTEFINEISIFKYIFQLRKFCLAYLLKWPFYELHIIVKYYINIQKYKMSTEINWNLYFYSMSPNSNSLEKRWRWRTRFNIFFFFQIWEQNIYQQTIELFDIVFYIFLVRFFWEDHADGFNCQMFSCLHQ